VLGSAWIAEAAAPDGDAADAGSGLDDVVVHRPPMCVEVEGHTAAAVLCVRRAVYAHAIAQTREAIKKP
jgi:hypothetical protein